MTCTLSSESLDNSEKGSNIQANNWNIKEDLELIKKAEVHLNIS